MTEDMFGEQVKKNHQSFTSSAKQKLSSTRKGMMSKYPHYESVHIMQAYPLCDVVSLIRALKNSSANA